MPSRRHFLTSLAGGLLLARSSTLTAQTPGTLIPHTWKVAGASPFLLMRENLMVGVQISLERTPMQFFYLGNGTRTAANHATLPEKSGTIALALTDKIIVGFSAFLPGGTTMLGNNCEKRIPVTGGSESFYFLSSQGNFAKGMIRCTRQSTSTGTPSILIEILTT